MSLDTQASSGTRYIKPNADFPEKFNRLPFVLEHQLANHPLFALPRLFDLARATLQSRPQDLFYGAGHTAGAGERWDQTRKKPLLAEAIKKIGQAGAWITLHQAQNDPEYGCVFQGCMTELKALTGVNFKKVMQVENVLIFITSPKQVTSYRIDRECNFLLQIRGSKTIYLFDRKDREVLPELEIERFWAVDSNSATYKPDLQGKATPVRLVPGNGVHIPVNDPHWLKNDNNISVSLSVNFTWKDSELANLYRANHLLRQFGIQPSPPGSSPLRDAAKNAMISASYVPARGVARLIRRMRGQTSRAT